MAWDTVVPVIIGQRHGMIGTLILRSMRQRRIMPETSEHEVHTREWIQARIDQWYGTRKQAQQDVNKANARIEHWKKEADKLEQGKQDSE